MRAFASLRSFSAVLLLAAFAAGCDNYAHHDHEVIVEGNDIVVRTFSFGGADLTISDDQLIGSYQREVPELDAHVVDDGAVLLYADGSLLLAGGGGTWTALPFAVGIDEDEDLLVDYTVSFTYSYDLQDLYVDVVASDTIYPFEDLPRVEYKLVMIPGNLYVSTNKAGIDYSDYEAVKQAYGIVE